MKAFNDTSTHLWGYLEMRVTLREGRDTMMVDSKFLVVPCKSVYNCILDRSFTVTLNVVESLIYLKLNYHNVHEDSVSISADLFGKKTTYKDFQQDQKEDKGKAIKINVTSLVRQLRDMGIKPQTCIENYFVQTFVGENYK